ncbi:hypothetical protein HAX54_040643, partial [Datura stramonium]|nr:hypothetical protein [Datura stramonium]
KDAKYAPEYWIDEGLLALEFPTNMDKLHELGVGTSYWFNAFLGTPEVDPSEYFIFLEKPPYCEICHTICGKHSSACWARDPKGTHSTFAFSYLNKEAKVWVK